MDKKAVKKTVTYGVVGLIIGVLFIGLMMMGAYPEGTTLKEVITVHMPLIIGGGIVGTIVAWLIMLL